MDAPRIYTPTEVLMAQHALSEEELEAYLARCPEEQRWAFGGWLRGERTLDGDLIEQSTPADDRS